jgi:hypothetical protein
LVPPTDSEWVRAELAAIAQTRGAVAKGRRLERLIRLIFGRIPGLILDDQDVVSAYRTQEMDLYFFNRREPNGLHFLDCPLIVECKGWTGPVDGRELRYFADLLRDRGRRDGIFIALHGITGRPDNLTAGFYHVATALASGQLVLVITGEDLRKACGPAGLVALLQRRMLDQVKSQILAIDRPAEGRSKRSGLRGKRPKP